MPKRRLAALSATALAAGALSAIGLGGTAANAAAATVSIDKTFTYKCDVYVNTPEMIAIGEPDMLLGNFAVGVRAQSTIPSTVYAGQTVAPTPTTITLGLPDDLWNATRFFTGGGDTTQASRFLDGSSSDSTLGFTVAGHQTVVPIDDLSVENAPIPFDASATNPSAPATPWTVPTAGTVRAIPVPAGLAGQSVTLQMPAAFTADAMLLDGVKFDEDGTPNGTEDLPTHLQCALPSATSPQLLATPIPVADPATTTVSVPAAEVSYGDQMIDYAVSGVGEGAVQVLEGSTVLADGTFSGGKGSVTLPIGKLALGQHQITVKYAEAYGSLASTSTGTITITKATTAVTSPPVVVTRGQAQTLSYTVSGADAGSVTVLEGQNQVATGTFAAGKGSVTLPTPLAVGAHTLMVKFAGDDNSLPSSGEAKVTVQEPTTVAVGAASSTYGQAAQVSYTVTGADSGAVQVLEGAAVLANGTFSGGKGSVSLPATLASGSHSITVKYAGSDFTVASAGDGTVAVAKAGASIASAKATPKAIKVKKTKAKLAVSVASAAGAPTGTVTVSLKGKKVGSAAVVNGKATVKLKAFKKAGKQKLTVAYSGAANFNGASSTVKVTVKK